MYESGYLGVSPFKYLVKTQPASVYMRLNVIKSRNVNSIAQKTVHCSFMCIVLLAIDISTYAHLKLRSSIKSKFDWEAQVYTSR